MKWPYLKILLSQNDSLYRLELTQMKINSFRPLAISTEGNIKMARWIATGICVNRIRYSTSEFHLPICRSKMLANCMTVWVTVNSCMYTVILSRWIGILKFIQNLENSWFHTKCSGCNGVIPCHERCEFHQEQDYSTFLQLYFVIWRTYFGIWLSDFICSLYLGMQRPFHRNEHVILRLWSEHPYLYLSKTEKILTK